MAAVVHLLGRGIQPRGGALTEEGAATVAAAARLLEAALNAGGQAASGAFGAAGGFAALRTALACGQLSGRHATEARSLLASVMCVASHGFLILVRACLRGCEKLPGFAPAPACGHLSGRHAKEGPPILIQLCFVLIW